MSEETPAAAATATTATTAAKGGKAGRVGCFFFRQGKCTSGSNCTFSHTTGAPKPAAKKVVTRTRRTSQKGAEKPAEAKAKAKEASPPVVERVKSAPVVPTSPPATKAEAKGSTGKTSKHTPTCYLYMKGRCKHGDACRFGHPAGKGGIIQTADAAEIVTTEKKGVSFLPAQGGEERRRGERRRPSEIVVVETPRPEETRVEVGRMPFHMTAAYARLLQEEESLEDEEEGADVGWGGSRRESHASVMSGGMSRRASHISVRSEPSYAPGRLAVAEGLTGEAALIMMHEGGELQSEEMERHARIVMEQAGGRWRGAPAEEVPMWDDVRDVEGVMQQRSPMTPSAPRHPGGPPESVPGGSARMYTAAEMFMGRANTLMEELEGWYQIDGLGEGVGRAIEELAHQMEGLVREADVMGREYAAQEEELAYFRELVAWKQR